MVLRSCEYNNKLMVLMALLASPTVLLGNYNFGPYPPPPREVSKGYPRGFPGGFQEGFPSKPLRGSRESPRGSPREPFGMYKGMPKGFLQGICKRIPLGMPKEIPFGFLIAIAKGVATGLLCPGTIGHRARHAFRRSAWMPGYL